MQQLLNIWIGLTFGRKLIAIAATIGMFMAILAMARMVNAPSLSLLYAGLEPSAAGEVVSALEARGVAYDVRGRAIFVDSSQRDQLRLTLASEGLPANGGGGYELLDSLNGFGTTSQMFDAAYWRAKEGELARTIVSTPNITSARVHISHGGGTTFQRGAVPTASVAVSGPGGDVSGQQAKALKYLVASAVSGLSPDDVAIIGAGGQLLGTSDEPSQGDAAVDRADRLRKKVERLLEARVGAGNAIVEVSVETVTEREAVRERIFDPSGRVAISTDTEEVSNASNQAGGGQVSVASNLPDGDAAAGDGSSSQNSQTRERVNYEVSETEREIVKAPGAIKRLTVAVLVNGTPQIGDDATAVEPRSDEEMQALRELVASAVGFVEDRGDVITIKSMGLQLPTPAGTEVSASLMDGISIDLMSAIQMAVLALVTLILGLFVVRPIVSGTANTAAPALPDPNGPAAELNGIAPLAGEAPSGFDGVDAGDLPKLPTLDEFSADPGGLGDLPMMGEVSSSPADRLRTMIGERQAETVEILRDWLDEKQGTAG